MRRDDPPTRVRDIDPGWAERLDAEATRYDRLERIASRRRAIACLVAAATIVCLGLVGFSLETDTRLARVFDIRSPGWVTVTLPHLAPRSDPPTTR